MSTSRRKDIGLGRTAAGGSGGSFAAHERDIAAPPVNAGVREVRELSALVAEDSTSRVMGGSTQKFYDPYRDTYIKLDAMHDEAIREEFPGRAALAMGLENAVQYDAKHFRDADGNLLIGVESHNFKSVGERERQLSYFRSDEFVEEDEDWDSDEEFFIENDDWKRLKGQIETMNSSTGASLSEDVLRMSAFDLIIGNTDRINNLSNIGVIEQADGSYRAMPPFDFGMAFPPQEEQELLGEDALEAQARSFAVFAREQYGHRKPLLEADEKALRILVETYDNSLYGEQEVCNIKNQLRENLRRTEGVLWRRKSPSVTGAL
ncbi:hypothetical protein [Leucobacter luti]|uniref:hypothetical protein n=1 Tax=Leucobacter luti TaxID=340320 RepID=UPI0010610F40|nr:hypothetical protein [Leucobacter luti]